MPFRDIIVAGINLVRSAIQSSNFVAGLTGWRIKKDGTAEFNDATFRGNIWLNGSQINVAQGIFWNDSANGHTANPYIAEFADSSLVENYLEVVGPDDGLGNQAGISLYGDSTITGSETLILNGGAIPTGLIQWDNHVVRGKQYFEECHRAAALVLTNNTTVTVVYDTRDFRHGNSPNSYDLSTGIWTAPWDGYYLISARVTSDALTAPAARMIITFFDGAGTNVLARDERDGNTGVNDARCLTMLKWFTAGDTVKCTYFQNSGVNRNMNVGATNARTISFKRIL